ncbi:MULTISPECIES: ABC transporter substrate-binding protein [Sporosarcina]|uniref:ABC transporter substrate-binding protein n=1 Tax=Sporosarcina TaxID=1569 RepID=UPI00129AC2A1|nr:MULTISPECIES: ABC transporter substrate-binding protein [Sporosarcina]GKV66133.1 ABC transporter substrate-binding protein [Sporosarcina sp. NCCP-2331]GLB56109.1 ABC transporter substrate-binding protein [Sporosarcina sp. NCCP-2378]
MKKSNILVTLLTLMALLLAACTGEEEPTNGGAVQADQPKEKTEVVFWHAMSGKLEEVVDQLVADFNEQQDDINVKAVFQGTYEESITKFNTVAGTKDAPTIMQVFEVGTKYMMDSGKIEPVQKFIDAENYDTSKWEQNITNYYAVDGEQYSMPFNSSTPILMYNKDAFKEAGLDPENPPTTYEELEEAAKALTTGEQYGFSILNYGWFIEELIAAQGGLFVNEDNGRKGDATEAVFNGEEGQKVFQLISDMYEDGTFYNTGQNWDDIRAAFQSGKIAMYLDSSAGVRDIVEQSSFEVGAGYLPVPEAADREGVIIGGASLWMANGIEESQQQAAWEFMKYLTSPEIQAKWHVNTGYFAINTEAYEQQIVQSEWEKYPQLKVTVDQLGDTKTSLATQGALISVFPEARQKVVNAMESLYQGTDPIEALNQAAEETNEALKMANRKK